MFDLFIDTSILRAENIFRGSSFTLLKALLKSGNVALHVSEIAVREFVSAKQSELDERLRQVRAGLLKVPRGSLTDAHATRLDSLLREADSLIESAASDYNVLFESWLKEAGACILPMSGVHARRAFDHYFAGTGTFERTKARQDIPDALIAEAIFERAKDVEYGFFVCADERLRKAIESCRSILTYPSLKECLSSPYIKPFVASTYIQQNLASVRSVLKQFEKEIRAEFHSALYSAMKGFVAPREHAEAIDPPWITNIHQIASLDLEWDQSEYLGRSYFDVPFTVQIIAGVCYHVRAPHDSPDTTDQLVLVDDAEAQYKVIGMLTAELIFKDYDNLGPEFVPEAEIVDVAIEIGEVDVVL